MAKLEAKKKHYEEMDIPVLYIHRDDIYEQKGEYWKLKKDAYDIVRWKILYMAQKRRSSGTQETQLDADKLKDYEYMSVGLR
jgi:hypothetical protein